MPPLGKYEFGQGSRENRIAPTYQATALTFVVKCHASIERGCEIAHTSTNAFRLRRTVVAAHDRADEPPPAPAITLPMGRGRKASVPPNMRSRLNGVGGANAAHHAPDRRLRIRAFAVAHHPQVRGMQIPINITNRHFLDPAHQDNPSADVSWILIDHPLRGDDVRLAGSLLQALWKRNMPVREMHNRSLGR